MTETCSVADCPAGALYEARFRQNQLRLFCRAHALEWQADWFASYDPVKLTWKRISLKRRKR